MHARFSPRSLNDLHQIRQYIAKDNEAAADRIVMRIFMSVEQMESFPFLGAPGRMDNTRELLVPGTKYLMVYSLPDEYHIDIERILHSARQFPPTD